MKPDCEYCHIGRDIQADNCSMCGKELGEDSRPAPCSALSGVEMLAFLVEETSEDAVFCFLHAISAFGIETMEHAQQAFLGDADVRRWVEASYRLIPKQNNQANSPDQG